MNTDRPGLAYIVHSLNPGGTERLVVEMSLVFAAEFDLHVLCLDEPGTWARRLRERGIPVHCLWRQPGLDLSLAVSLASYFRRAGTRIVHAHQCTPWFYAALSRLIYPAPRLLLEEHGRFYPEVDNRLRRLVNRLLIGRLTHDMVAVSADVRQRLERYEGLDSRRIAVQYNGVAPESPLLAQQRSAVRRELGFGPDDFVVGTVGRFDPIKNLPMLVEGLARVSQSCPAIRGLLVGDGPLFAQIHAQVQRSGLGQRIALTGFRDDARRLIQCMDLFVLCSFSEGTSMALLEAAAAGVPVVVTGVGGNPEIVLDGATGRIISSDSVEELVRAIHDCYGEPEERQRLASAGRQRFEQEFTLERMIEGYRGRYRALLPGAGDRIARAAP